MPTGRILQQQECDTDEVVPSSAADPQEPFQTHQQVLELQLY